MINKYIAVVFMRREPQNTFATIFGSHLDRQKTGRRVLTHNHSDTYDNIFGKYVGLPPYEYEENDEDSFQSIYGRKRREVTSHHVRC